MSVYDWSTTPANNNATPPNGWPEGMLRSDVNNVGRQMMADVAAMLAGFPWLNLGKPYTITRNSNTQFQFESVDLTAFYTVGRRVKQVGATTVYGRISVSAFSGGDTVVTVVNDAAANVPTSLTEASISVSDTRGVADPNGLPAASIIPVANGSGLLDSWVTHPVVLLTNSTSSAAQTSVTYDSIFPGGYSAFQVDLKIQRDSSGGAAQVFPQMVGRASGADLGATAHAQGLSGNYWDNGGGSNVHYGGSIGAQALWNLMPTQLTTGIGFNSEVLHLSMRVLPQQYIAIVGGGTDNNGRGFSISGRLLATSVFTGLRVFNTIATGTFQSSIMVWGYR